MLSIVSTAAIGLFWGNRLCVEDEDCAQGEQCKITLPPRITRACVEREKFEMYDRCSNEFAHCCPQGTTCRGWWGKRCFPVVGRCEKKPDICCLAFPTCGAGYELDKDGVCTDADFKTGTCKTESLCCSKITCVKEKPKTCTLSCGTVVPAGWEGNGEGDNHCNTCTCSKDGQLGCTKIGCPTRGCPKPTCTLSCGTVVDAGWFGFDEGDNHCNKCSCEKDGSLSCTKIGCPARGCPKPTCTLSCGTIVEAGWQGSGEGDNHCNSCTCSKDGQLGCTEKACEKRGCAPTGKPCTLACGTVVKSGWAGSGEGPNSCNQCQCNDGNLGCTRQFCTEPKPCPCNAYTRETPCIALEGVCYNAGTCACEKHPFQTNCLVAPCSQHSCEAGYKCRDNYCGGCNHQCVKEE